MKNKHVVEAEERDGWWWATEEATGKTARGSSEDIAVSNWWALYAIDDKYPRKGMDGYVSHDVPTNPEEST